MNPQKVFFSKDRIHIITDDGREGSLPLRLYPRLYNATSEQLQNYTLSHFGIHWSELDEDLFYDGFFSPENMSKENNPIGKIFFEYPELNIRQVARGACLNPTLLQQYVDGVKIPSANRAKQIVDSIHRLGAELLAVSVE